MYNVGTPRFYINVPEWLHNMGIIQIPEQLMTVPVIPEPSGYGALLDVGSAMNNSKNFIAMLNCPRTSSMNIQPQGESGIPLIDIINKDAEYDGFRMASFTNTVENFNIQGVAGSIIVGNYYDMPHSPDLSLSLSYEYDGIQTQQTKGGSTISNASFIKPADWGDSGAWQLGSDEIGRGYSNLRTGRRVWSLSFSYLSDTNLMPTLGVQRYEEVGTDVLDGTDFFSQVFNRTIAGHIPFIFQPDNTNNEADQFAICRFDMDSLTYSQIAYNTYNISLQIREVW